MINSLAPVPWKEGQEPEPGRPVVGVKVGQTAESTAIVVVQAVFYGDRPSVYEQRAQGALGWDGPEHFMVRHMERMELGAPYPGIAARVADVVEGVRQEAQDSGLNAGRANPIVWVDATDIGMPFMDELYADEGWIDALPVYFNWGDRRLFDHEEKEDPKVTMGKAWLVSRTRSLLQLGRLHLPSGNATAGLMRRELLDYEIRPVADANDRHGAFKVGSNDDLVTALGMAVQISTRGREWLPAIRAARRLRRVRRRAAGVSRARPSIGVWTPDGGFAVIELVGGWLQVRD